MSESASYRKVKFNDERNEVGGNSGSGESEVDDELDAQFNKFQLLSSEDFSGCESDNQLTTDDNICNDSDTKSDRSKTTDQNQSVTKSKNTKNRRRNPKKKQTKIPQSIPNESFLLNPQPDQSNKPNTSSNMFASDYLRLLKLDMRNLNPDIELKRMFGRSVLKEDKSREVANTKARNSQRSRFAPAYNLENLKYQSGHFPRMELDDHFNVKPTKVESLDQSRGRKKPKDVINSVNEEVHFKYVHDIAYQRVQSDFINAVHHGISELVLQIYTNNPTHVESLVKLSDMMRISENHKDAAHLIERALLIMERGFHPKFNPALGVCRLSYRRPENRTLFITLFKHINCLNRRGLRRTPLEFTKFLLSLDPDNDPLFAMLMIDYFCIRSEEYDFLIDFVSKWHHISKLPNFNLSLALAYFMKSRSSKLGKSTCEDNLKLADDLLQRALLRYPNFIVQLLDACSAEPDGVKKCDYFNYTIFGSRYKTVPESVELLVSVYVQRTCPIWKVKHVMEWLEKNVELMVDKFSKKELVDQQINIETWSGFRGPVPRNLLRHVILSELSVKLPPSVSGISNIDIDPFPPDPIVSYELRTTSNHPPMPSSSPFSLFIRSIMPSFTQTVSDNQRTDHEAESLDEELINYQIAQLAEDNSLPTDVLESLTNMVINSRNNSSQADRTNNESRRDSN